MGTVYAPRCCVCGSPAFRLDERHDDIRWLCYRHSEQVEQEIAERTALRLVRLRAASIHEDLGSRSVAYRCGFEGLDETCPYDSRSLDAALWRLGSLVALRGAL